MGLKNSLLCLYGLFCSVSLAGQSWTVERLENLNTGFSEFPAFMHEQSLIYYTDQEKDLLHSEDWKLKSEFELYRSGLETRFIELQKGKSWSLSLSLEGRSITLCPYPEGLNWLVLSKNSRGTVFSRADTAQGQIRVLESLGSIDLQIVHISPTDSDTEYVVAYLDDLGNEGAQLGLLQFGGINPAILPLNSLNTSFNEVFPLWHQGDLYFSSDQDGGLDIYFASREEQWKVVQKLPAPLNSEADDFSMVFLNDDRGFFASSRKGGSGQDDIYLFEKIRAELLEGYSGRLSVRDRGLKDVLVKIYNELGELISQTRTDENGGFELPGMEDAANYRVVPEGDPRVLSAAVLELMNPESEITQRIVANADGHFIFEFLPYLNPGGLTKMDNPDNFSLFGIRISGRVLEDREGVEEGNLVILMDGDGTARQVTYTGDSGEFEFSEVDPKASYQFGLERDQVGAEIRIDGDPESLPKSPEGTYLYQRLEEGTYKTLILPDGAQIEIRSGEALNLNKIDYEFDAWQLDSKAKGILQELSALVKLNTGLKVELLSHTDSRGSQAYNLELSQKRARAAVDYLIELGVSPGKLIGKGMGESQLRNECGDEVDCPDEKHAENRRTEVILRME